MLKIAYTCGDLGGIGPEIFYKFQKSFQQNPLSNEISITLIDEEFAIDDSKITLGKPSAYAGEHAAKVLDKASTLIKSGDLDYLVTGPVAKESLWLAGIEYSGQTELLASINGLTKDEIEMFFVLGDLRMVLATRHVALNQVTDEIGRRFDTVLKNSSNALTKIFKLKNPKIAVAGINPHAGENGLIGLEEKQLLEPLIQKFQMQHSKTIDIKGPYSADYLLANAAQKYLKNRKPDYDLYVCAYHDQALPLIKGLGGYQAVNLTVGLPFVRLSVDHGTAFDIAGTNQASYEGLIACTKYCLNLNNL